MLTLHSLLFLRHPDIHSDIWATPPLFLGSVSVFVASLVVSFRLWQWVPLLSKIAT